MSKRTLTITGKGTRADMIRRVSEALEEAQGMSPERARAEATRWVDAQIAEARKARSN